MAWHSLLLRRDRRLSAIVLHSGVAVHPRNALLSPAMEALAEDFFSLRKNDALLAFFPCSFPEKRIGSLRRSFFSRTVHSRSPPIMISFGIKRWPGATHKSFFFTAGCFWSGIF